MGWTTVLKAGKPLLRWTMRGSKATIESVGSAVIHPQRTLKGLGTATKTAAIGGAVGYVGWEKLTTDKSVAGIVGDAVLGEGTMESVGNTVSGVVGGVHDLTDKVGGMTDSVNNAMTDVNSKWSGMSNFLRGVFSGNGGGMMGNFFGNLGRGNVSGLSIAGLVLAAMLIFGRFGWLAKISGAVLAMMMIGNNANMAQLLGGNQPQQQPQLAQVQPEQEQQTAGGGRRR
ncbi:MAG: hypothetical protein J6Q60_04910 [Bacteroidaceae bacterium]|nr:hypothetical protein [Bacteroidaceae bacterium]